MSSDNKLRLTKSKPASKKSDDTKSKNKKLVQNPPASSSDDDSTYYSSDEEDEQPNYKHKHKHKQPTKLDKPDKSNKPNKIQSKHNNDTNMDSDSDADNDNKKYKTRSNTGNDNKRNKPKAKPKPKSKHDDDEDDNDEDNDTIICEDDSSERGDEKPQKKKFNIILIGDAYDDDDEYYDDDEDWETCSNNTTENEDDPISSDSENEEDDDDENSDEDNEGDENAEDDEFEDEKLVSRKRYNRALSKLIKRTKTKAKAKTADEDSKGNGVNVIEDTPVLKKLRELLETNPDDKNVQQCISVYESNIKEEKVKQERKHKKERERNERIFKKILRDKNTTNDFEFYEKLETAHQKQVIKKLREINAVSRIEKPYRLTLIESDIPVQFKAVAFKKMHSLRYMEPGSGEYYKIKNWVDTFMRIPFNTYKTLPVTIEDSVEKCHDFMALAQQTLDNAVYGLNDAKMQVMQMLGQLITNPSAVGTAIALHGPPGTGKTSMIKEGVSKILQRPFAFIALGGATDSSFLEGHGYTYEGSTWGKIVQILIDSQCMNPVIYFDELDKISDTPKGEEIAGILTHLTDTSQNTQFHDKYFSEIDFDLSKCLFIFSYNDESKINPILRDRMYCIKTSGYNVKQKTVISTNYLLPKIREQVKFGADEIVIPEETIQHIVETYCNKEAGVRNLKRCLEIIYTKLNLYRLMRPGTNLFEEDMTLNVTFPFVVSKDLISKLIKHNDPEWQRAMFQMYV